MTGAGGVETRHLSEAVTVAILGAETAWMDDQPQWMQRAYLGVLKSAGVRR
ncbi:hypothetical protein [Arthrobacter sp. 08Y14]|uniref:hypothetical protein n=1 Tax=Arthrobacter sp. 08Y14 TaxID=2058885 RepID=UPI0015E29B46|nr:hypothetical protein [Arthrobacter sp. 08Y14]